MKIKKLLILAALPMIGLAANAQEKDLRRMISQLLLH